MRISWIFLRVLGTLLALVACQPEKPQIQQGDNFTKVELDLDNTTPTVIIDHCRLITNNPAVDSLEARAVLAVKRGLPLAMQGKDSTLFETILASNFSFTSDSTEFFNRNAYIQDRIHGTWTIDTVTYQNLTLQFLRPDLGLLTYKNVLRGTDDKGQPDLEYYTWADIFIKENKQWKYLVVHGIDSRVEYPSLNKE
ncbi:MAG: nuclear transport factor 2 family protein [Lewinellaceae bacterium]|nr:nuclear transport factor 2 family protein [Lewinellaceae bacterium]